MIKNSVSSRRKTVGLLLIAVGVIALLAAGGVYLHNALEEKHAAVASDHAAQILLNKIAANMGSGENPATTSAPNAPSDPAEAPSGTETANSENQPPAENLHTVNVEGESYIGILQIPSQHLQLPVNAQWSYPRLKNSPCRYSGSVEEDTLTVAAHNYRYHFGKLTNLRVGDEVTFTDTSGNVYTYTVAEIETIAPTSIDKIVNNKFDLNLFTCNYSGDARVAVKCIRQT